MPSQAVFICEITSNTSVPLPGQAMHQPNPIRKAVIVGQFVLVRMRVSLFLQIMIANTLQTQKREHYANAGFKPMEGFFRNGNLREYHQHANDHDGGCVAKTQKMPSFMAINAKTLRVTMLLTANKWSTSKAWENPHNTAKSNGNMVCVQLIN